MLTLQKISARVQKLFPLLLIGGVSLGLIFPALAQALKPYILVLIALLVFFPGLRIRWGDVGRLMTRRPLLVLVSLVVIFAVVPLIPWVLGRFFPVDYIIVIGFALTAAAPVLLSGPYVTNLAGGDTSVTWALTILSSLLAPLTVSLGAHWLIGPSLNISIPQLALNLAMALLLPLAIATLLQRFAPRLTSVLQSVDGLGSSVAITLINLVLIGINRSVFVETELLPLAYMLGSSLLVDFGVFFTTRSLTARALGDPTSKALALSFGMKNVGLVGGPLALQDPRLAVGAGVISVFHALMFIMVNLRRDRV